MLPLTIGTPEQFSLLRTFLREANYTEAGIAERAGIDTIFEFKPVYERRPKEVEPPADALGALIHLLMDGLTLDECRLRTLFPSEIVDVMNALGILGSIEEGPERPHYATVLLYPVAGLYAASDRTTPANPKKPVPHPRDVVYAAITGNTGRFLAAQPPIACEDFLDLCSGTGIAAMVAAARYAKHAWACDITERSVHFSEFNRLLNGLENVTSARGDLYEAVAGRTFDRIVAHPPYIPAQKQEWVFRDGGVDGEQILRRIVEGLPRYLRPEGRFYCVTLATDREGESFEQRIRRWLGAAESEFDVVLAAHEVRTLPEEIRAAQKKRLATRRMVEEIDELVLKLNVTGTFYGTVAIRRKTEQRPAVTARTSKSPKAGSEATEWLLDFETAAARSGFHAFLRQSRPHFTRGMKMLVTHKPENGALVPSEFSLQTQYPFVLDGACAPWVAIAVTWFDGTRTAGEVYAELKSQQVVSEELGEAEFLGVLQMLVSVGVLELNEYSLPCN